MEPTPEEEGYGIVNRYLWSKINLILTEYEERLERMEKEPGSNKDLIPGCRIAIIEFRDFLETHEGFK